MLRLHESLVQMLKADEEISSLLPGGVWNRELNPTPNAPGSTASAWAPINSEDPNSPKQLQNCMVVRDGGEFGAFFPLGDTSQAMIFGYAQASDAGRAVLAQLDWRLRQLFQHTHAAIPGGDGKQYWGQFSMNGHTPILDDPAYGANIFTSWQVSFATSFATDEIEPPAMDAVEEVVTP